MSAASISGAPASTSSHGFGDQSKDGIGAEIIYPHGVFTTFASPDPDFQMVMARVLNDYYHEIFGAHRDRLVVSAVLPMMDLDAAITEAERVAKLGFRSLSIPIGMTSQPYNLADVRAVLVGGRGDGVGARDAHVHVLGGQCQRIVGRL